MVQPVVIYLVLTHDIDWSIRGPGVRHILERKNRFDDDIIKRVLEEGFNPYYGIPTIMEVEERLGVRSTFFFRPYYDDGTSVDLYGDVIKELVRRGWEVGLHNNIVTDREAVSKEKKTLENIVGAGIKGCRVHYLRIKLDNLRVLKDAGFLYDSSIVFTKDKLDYRNAGFLVVNGLVEFPITFMDAYLFTYMKLSEEKVVNFIAESLDELIRRGIRYATLLWHDNSILMRGGRVYPKLLEYLASREDIIILRGIDAYNQVASEERGNGL